jgi:hypothetical protein
MTALLLVLQMLILVPEPVPEPVGELDALEVQFWRGLAPNRVVAQTVLLPLGAFTCGPLTTTSFVHPVPDPPVALAYRSVEGECVAAAPDLLPTLGGEVHARWWSGGTASTFGPIMPVRLKLQILPPDSPTDVRVRAP